jgi:alpha-amylase
VRRIYFRSPVLALALLTLCGLALADAGPVVVVPRYTHPGAGQIFYFLLTDRFANGNPDNDRGGIAGSSRDHGFDPAQINHYHGGDFAGLTARLDYLQRLGITAVWVTPPFRNQAVRIRSGNRASAGYHGYWILDFLHVDPHLGTDEDFTRFVAVAHARGMRVFLDIVANHTADVIHFGGDTTYVAPTAAPYRDAEGRPFDVAGVTANGIANPPFPALSAEKSFARVPQLSAGMEQAKNPAWLNDVTLYHNRGNRNRTAPGSDVPGDFGGLDDVFTEHPRVVQGFIEVFAQWIDRHKVDGFRIDTARHVNLEFWQAFVPALRAHARARGHPGFLQFGEVYDTRGGGAALSRFSTGAGLIDTTLDFSFFAATRKFVSQGAAPAVLLELFDGDDYYTDHDGNVHTTPTFLGNHDAGRFAHFLQQDNPDASPELIADLVRLGHGLLFLARGQPVVYYGDEQGMIGRGGDHEGAREDMFAAQTPEYRDAELLATTQTGAADKFDESHPFYRLIRQLGDLRAAHAALRTGAMLVRTSSDPGLFAFSRIERGERVEYLVALNNSRTATLTSDIATSQPAGARLTRLFASPAVLPVGNDTLTADAQGRVHLTLAPLQFAVWRAETPLSPSTSAPRIVLTEPAAATALEFNTSESEGLIFASRQEIRAEVSGGDGFAEVTFAMQRASRPGQYELLGTDDAPPYRVFWQPPADLAPDEKLTFLATVSDLRGHQASARIPEVAIIPNDIPFGVRGAIVPSITSSPPTTVRLADHEATLRVTAEGTTPLEYQWLRDDSAIPGATAPSLALPQAAPPGRYSVLVRNLAGTAISQPTLVTADAAEVRE